MLCKVSSTGIISKKTEIVLKNQKNLKSKISSKIEKNVITEQEKSRLEEKELER